MPTFSQILGGLVVIAALAMAAHEIRAYNSLEAEGLGVSPRRLRRRLIGVVLILGLVAILTWAGHAVDTRLKLGLYLISVPVVFLLVGLAYGDLRETSRQIVGKPLDLNPEEMRLIMEDPALRDLLGKVEEAVGSGGSVGESSKE